MAFYRKKNPYPGGKRPCAWPGCRLPAKGRNACCHEHQEELLREIEEHRDVQLHLDREERE